MDYGNMGDSECSSGCESGWTLYLENSYMAYEGNRFLEGKGGFSQENGNEQEEEEEEDLSMVSDASSGPPQFVEEEEYGNDNNGCSYNAAPVNSAAALPLKRQKNKKKENRRKNIREHHPSALDDTASSPILNLNNNNFTINNQDSVENVVLDFSQGYSTTHLQGRSVYQEQYGFFMPSLLPENQLLVQNQWYEGKKWG